MSLTILIIPTQIDGDGFAFGNYEALFEQIYCTTRKIIKDGEKFEIPKGCFGFLKNFHIVLDNTSKQIIGNDSIRRTLQHGLYKYSEKDEVIYYF